MKNKIKPQPCFTIGNEYRVMHIGPQHGLKKHVAQGYIYLNYMDVIRAIEDARVLLELEEASERSNS